MLHPVLKCVLAAAVLAAVCVGALLFGPAAISVSSVLSSLFNHLPFVNATVDESADSIVWNLRAPRVVLAVLVGGALSIAGASYQAVFRNPLADPYLLGAAAGAGVGATIAIVIIDNGALITPLAFVGAIVGVTFAYFAGTLADPARNPASILLAGVATASFLTAIQTYLQQQNVATLPQVYSWILGHLTTAGWNDVMQTLPYVAVSSIALIAVSSKLDVMSLGDEKAATLGVNVNRMRAVVVVAASLATAAAVSVSGLIGFVGLIVPHLVRFMFGHSNRVVIPLAFVVGGTFMVLADLIARTALSPAELPIGVVTALIGAPFFFIVMWRASRGTA